MVGFKKVCLRAALVAVCVLFLPICLTQPALGQVTEDPSLLNAQAPSGSVSHDRISDVVERLRSALPAYYTNLLPPRFASFTQAANDKWTFSGSASPLGFPLNYTATLSVAATDPAAGGVLLRFDATIGEVDLLPPDFKLKQATLSMAVSPGANYGSYTVAAALDNASFSFGNATLAATIPFKSDNQNSFTLTANASLGDMFPPLAKAPKANAITLQSLMMNAGEVQAQFALNGKTFTITGQPGFYTLTPDSTDLSTAITLGDVIPGADLIPFLSNVALTQIRIMGQPATLTVATTYLNKSMTLRIAQNQFSLTAPFPLSTILPMLQNVPVADQTQFASLALDDQKAVFTGSYNGKAVSVTKTRGKDATLDISTAGLGLGDLVPQAAQTGLDQYVELDQIEVASDHIAVDMKVNGNETDVYILRNQPGGKQAALFYFSKLDAAAFIPNSDGDGLSGVGLTNTLIGFGQENRSFTQADLPGDLASKVTLPSNGNFTIMPDTAALTGTFDLSSSQGLMSALSAVSISQTSFPINGTFHSDTIRRIPSGAKSAMRTASTADKAMLLSRLNLSAPIGLPSVPGLSSYARLNGPMVLSIKGNNDTSNPRADFDGQFPIQMTIGGSEMDLVANLDMDKGLSGQGSSSSISIALANAWNQPFGVPGIVVDTGSFTIDLSSNNVSDLSLQGSATFAGRDNVGVTANFARDSSGNLTFQYFEFDASQGFKLSGLPGFGSIPHADQFTVDTIKLSPDGITAKTMLNNVHVDTFIFKDPSGGAVFAVDQQGLRLVDMFSGLAGTPLKDLTLGNAAIVVSENGLTGDPKTMPSTAQDLFKDIFGASNVALLLPAGVALLSKIDFSQSGAVSKGLQKLGVNADAAVVMGGVSGLFGSSASPSLNLSIMMDQIGDASGLPKNVMKYKAGTQPGFFLNWAGTDVDFGARTAMMVTVGRDQLEFTTSIEVVFSDGDVGLNVTGGMAGTWDKPFGIQPLSLSDVTLTTGVDVEGNVDFGFAGSQTFGQESLSFATNMKFLLEAEGLPDAVAFSGDADTIGYGAILEIAQAAIGGKLNLDEIKLPTFDIKKFHFAFATPGATDPQLGLVSEGVGFSGIFSFLGQDLGSVTGSAGTSGLKFKGDLTDFTLGPVSFNKNNIDIQVSLQPKATLTSDIAVLGATETVLVDLTPPTLDFIVTVGLDQFGNGNLTFEMAGVDLNNGRFDPNADISFTGSFTDNIVPRLIQVMRDGTAALRTAADGKLDDDKKALADAQAKVGALDQKVADARKQANQAKQSAEAKVQAAQARVDSLQNEISNDQNEANTCGNSVTHYFCKPYWEIRMAGAEAAKAVATGVLDAAKVAINVAYDLDPTVLALEAERDTERLGLSIAMAVVQGSEDVINAVTGPFEQEIEQVLNSLPFTIQQVTFAGDLKRMIANDEPLLLDMQYTLLQQARRDYLAFKIKDWDFNAKSFAVLPALVAQQVVSNISSKISPKVADWLNSHIGTELAAASDDIRDEVLKAEAKFENTLKGMETNTAPFQSAVDRLSQQRQQTASELGATDFLGSSQQFDLTYLAVGHSALCLAVATDGTTVHQEDCKDNATEQWHTIAVDDYVQLVANGLCLQAQDDAADASQQGVKLMLKSCDANDKSEQWKVATYDGIYSQIINRASQKCLHFDSENARPETAKAVWTSCIGMDSQNFRAIPDAERPDFVPKGSRLASAASTCVWFYPVGNNWVGYETGTCGADYGQSGISRMRNVQQAIFDYVEMVDGTIRMVHRVTPTADAKTEVNDGMCFYASGQNATFNDAPCNRATGVTYDVLEVQQHFMLQQTGTNLCVEIGNIQQSPNSYSIGPFLMACNNQKPEQLLRWEAPLPPS
ncbi:MAG: ricin-type beta-trefoil lectin domain protein [Ferrovibrio sp.]|uniref:ricin-type beta-trefoil lectin domain protein n=1 Tax=Ferrovibrio sp. TaxID=1917215 RepID=UPI00391BDD2B